MRDDTVYLFTFPKRVTRRGAIKALTFGAGLAGLFLLDHEIRVRVGRQRSESLRQFEPLGNFRETHLAVLATYGAGELFRHEPTAETGRALVEAMLFTDLCVGLGKTLLGRNGPWTDEHGDFFGYDDGGRLPSGHTARAFSIATVLAERHGRVAAWIGYPVAALVGLSRIQAEQHWASDVLAGAALGYVVGRAVVRQRGERAAGRVRLRPAFVQQDEGIAVMLRISLPVGN